MPSIAGKATGGAAEAQKSGTQCCNFKPNRRLLINLNDSAGTYNQNVRLIPMRIPDRETQNRASRRRLQRPGAFAEVFLYKSPGVLVAPTPVAAARPLNRNSLEPSW